MGTRYIWKKSEVQTEYPLKSEQKTSLLLGSKDSDWYIIGLQSEPVFNSETGTASYHGYVAAITPGSWVSPGIEAWDGSFPYVCFLTYKPSGDLLLDEITITGIREYAKSSMAAYTAFWNKEESGSSLYLCLESDYGDDKYEFTYYYISGAETGPGTLVGYISSSNPSAYPNYSDTGGYFYEAIDNDDIDPVSISIPQTIISGDSITVSLTESSGAISSEYGSISYLFGTKYDNENWSSNQPGTGLTYSFAVSSGKTELTVRAYATDGIGYTSSTPLESETRSIQVSHPPTAPGSISVNRTVNGWDSTVKITAASDPDGTIVNYKYFCIYKSANTNAEWPEIDEDSLITIATTNSLEVDYKIDTSVDNDEIIFLASAIDDSGLEGPKVKSNAYSIENNTITLLGPSKTDFGNKIGSFKVEFSAIVSGDVSDKTLTLVIKNDESILYNSSIESDSIIEVDINVDELSAGEHTIYVTASKEGYNSVMATYTYRITDLVMPENANVVQFQDHNGKAVFAEGHAESIFMSDGTTIEDVINTIKSRLDALEG